MGDLAAHRVALDLANDRELRVPVDVEAEDRVRARVRVERVVELAAIDGDGKRLGERRAIGDGGDPTGPAERACDALARPRATCGSEGNLA